MEGSAGGAGPCGWRGERGEETRGGESLQEERKAAGEDVRGEKMRDGVKLDGRSCVKRGEKHI